MSQETPQPKTLKEILAQVMADAIVVTIFEKDTQREAVCLLEVRNDAKQAIIEAIQRPTFFDSEEGESREYRAGWYRGVDFAVHKILEDLGLEEL